MQPALTLLLLSAASAASASALPTSAPLTLLPANTLGRCLDGTASGFYFLPASSPASHSKWTITLYGGGECNSDASCSAHLHDSLGSSKYFASSASFTDHYADASTASNPGFGDWNHVQVPYCSQDLHTGTRTNASAETFGLFFSGRLVYEAVLTELDALGLASATDILLTGDSAGGIGVWPNLDSTAQRYPSARVVGAPVAGFYFYAFPYTGPNHTHSILSDFSPAGWRALHALYASYVDEDCGAAHASDPSFCMLANNSLPFISSSVFVTEAQTDQVVLLDHDDVPAQWLQQPQELAYLREWAGNMSVALSPLLATNAPRNGAFTPACFIHTSFSASAPLIEGVGFLQAAAAWYSGASPASQYKLSDSCGIMCNPSCPTS
jgi:hypothetical protein